MEYVFQGQGQGGQLDQYTLGHAARADMQRRMGHLEAARTSYQRALELTRLPADVRFLQCRLAQIARISESSLRTASP